MTFDQSENPQFDIRGQICPSSLLVALREVNKRQQEIKAGRQHLILLTDNRDATTTIPEALINMGYNVSVAKEGSYYVITVTGQPV
ncbi:MAG: sulfurtransferase TusA family protein [Deltaproteobacteria bacterium]|nr:sulfurtransferase TusA family protein [Candidatus Anaeroferrophillus wilburensis]MBN2888189.1 sulfurtransferase TusA family protein [Deltaproteobacteria bacterium]